ncbi:tetratricopeptide repeat protein [Streptomyces sp. NPDC059582]|uniref:tetratricopeptide repeat protein n=1 Tax=Streptomyces sp. NPDC059582 TaxID=3346875 RepID=UPI0036BF769B
MQRRRVVTVEGPHGPGSGYVIAPELVLTSAHVVPPEAATVRLFRPGEQSRWQARVVWRGTPGGRDDAALLSVDDPAWVPPDGAGPGWGRLVTDRPGTPCDVAGGPDLIQRPDRPAELWHATGTINPLTGRAGNRHVLSLNGTAPEPTGAGTSPWGGLSGAAVFCDGLLTGVVASDLAGLAHSGLDVVPAYVLHHDPAFRSTLAAHGAGPDDGGTPEPVEWQQLADTVDTRPAPGLLSSPAVLLRARRAVVPFRGRADLLGQLRAWCAEPGFGAWLVHGPAGQGKTRLAHHLTAERATDRWATLWLRADAPAAELTVLAEAAVPALVVVDYAETRLAQLADLLRALARHDGGAPMKVLLLARTAEDWWENLQTGTSVAEQLLDGAPVSALDPLEPDSGDRAGAYRQAADSFAAVLRQVRGWQHHPWPALAADLALPTLEDVGLATALTLHMTVLADLLDAATGTGAVTGPQVPRPETVEDRLLLHEHRYWRATATARHLHPDLTMDTLTDALAAAFLLGADDRDQADALLARVPDLSDQPRDRRSAVRTWIRALYPPGDARPWDGLQPDRLAERFLGRHLHRHPHLPGRLLPGATTGQATRLLTVYARAATQPSLSDHLSTALTTLCAEHPGPLAAPAIEVATRTEDPRPLIDGLHRITDDPSTPTALLEHLADQLPRTSHNLADLAAHLLQRLVQLYRDRAADPARLPDLAHGLDRFSYRLGVLRRYEEGLAASTEAVAIWRRLCQEQPSVHRAHLAEGVNGLALRLAALGQQQEALATIEEAVAIRRELAAERAEVHLDNLAKSLNNLSVRLGKLQHGQEALDAIAEAVAIRRELAADRPEAYLPDLANNVHNLSARLAAVGRHEEALTAVEEAVALRRRLADTLPDAFLPPLALSLNNLAVRLGALNRREEALTAIGEAVTIRRRLATARPAVHEPHLATCLSNRSTRLAALDRHDEALTAIAEAVTVRRGLAAARPDAYNHALAHSLRKYALCLNGLGRDEEARAATAEAARVDQGRRGGGAGGEGGGLVGDLAHQPHDQAAQQPPDDE